MTVDSSSVDSQYETYEKFLVQHENTRREHQTEFIQPLEILSDSVKTSISTDKHAYQQAEQIYYAKYNLFKRLFTSEPSKYKDSSVRPLKYIYLRRRDLDKKLDDLLVEIKSESNPLEIRTSWNGSIAVVYNPQTGRAEWRENWHGGVHGAYNPHTRTIEWLDEARTGVYGVFNPKLNVIEWKKYFHGGVHGVYNPSSGEIEWKTSFHSGIGGVYNPLTEQVEWKTSYNGGVIGYFDDESQTVKWIEKWHHGLALIHWSSLLNTYITTASCGWYGDK